MQKTHIAALGCMVLMTAALVPMGTAHVDPGKHMVGASTGLNADVLIVNAVMVGGTPSASPHVDDCAYVACPPLGSPTAAAYNRPSGWYFGPAGPFVGAASDNATAGPADDTLIAFGGGFALCDMEVVDGVVLDEGYVDGVDTFQTTSPDGLVNDGGLGAACHVDYGAAMPASYSTFGCGYDHARGEDAVFGGELWIGAGCSYQHPETVGDGTTLLDLLLSDAGDCINDVLAQDTTLPCLGTLDSVDCLVGNTVGCTTDQINCLTGSPLCPPAAGTFACGADSTVTAMIFGEGDGHTNDTPGNTDEDEDDWVNSPYWAAAGGAQGVKFPGEGNCAGYGIATIFTFASAVASVSLSGSAVAEDPIGSPANGFLVDVNAQVPTTGWLY